MSGNMRSRQEQASDWIVLLHEAPDDASTQKRFEAWLDAAPENALAWVAATDTFETIDAIGPELEAHWRRADTEVTRQTSPSARESRSPRQWVGRNKLARSASILASGIAACLTLWFAPDAMLHVQSDFTTRAGELQTVQLADGSTVHLGPSSAIAVDYENHKRTVQLLVGEAWFDVTHNPAAPFSVEAGDVNTTVLGTSFDVRRSGAYTAISLKRGRVRVIDQGATSLVRRELTPGQWMRIGPDHAVESGRSSPDLLGLWLTGTLVARNRPIAEVIEELRPWFAGRIVLLDADLGRKRVDGVYNARQTKDALSALVERAGGNVRRITPWLIVVS
ncbi:MAG: FecR domain-containing protein [Novosphingobium sp.]